MIHVFCATRGRPKIAEQLIHNLVDTSDCEIIIIVGQNEDEFKALTKLGSKRVSIYFEPYSPSFSYSVNAGWGRVRYQVGTDKNILGIATADDHKFKDGWHGAALKCYNEQFPSRDGLMFLHDITTATKNTPRLGKAGPCVVSAKFCDLYMGGWLVSPYYHCNALDTEYAGVAELHDKLGYCPESVVQHLMHDWKHTKNAEQRKLGMKAVQARCKRGYKYDLLASWRHWT